MNEDSYDPEFVARPDRTRAFGALGTVGRLGLATRGNTRLGPDAVLEAVRRGVNYLNWPGAGYADGLSAAVRRLGDERKVRVAAQFKARTRETARRELRDIAGELGIARVDALTYYYVESREEWQEITAPGGAAEVLEEAKRNRRLGAIGITTHQRDLAASIAESGRVDFLMIRYNAAHVGAELDVFPVTQRSGLPVVTYTGLRWGALLRATPDDPAGFTPPSAPDWYRFVLCHPAVTVGVMAPNGERELEENLAILDDWRGFEPERYRELREHGARVYRHAGSFP